MQTRTHHFSLGLVSVVLAVVVSACGAPESNESAPLVARDAETEHTDPAPLLAFVAAANQILGSASHSGAIPASKFVAMIPLSNQDRQTIQVAYPGAFQVNCVGQRCSATASGQAVQGTLLASVRINFLLTITDPTLFVEDQITTDFVLRGDQGVEFCNLSGLSVSKLGVTKTIYGLHDRVEGGQAKLTVGDEDSDYTCDL